MRFDDVVGFAGFGLFGVWWLLFPKTVLRFYKWFHRGKARMPGPSGVRIAGALWVALLLGVFWLIRVR
jgi:hypothetical protein